MLRRGKSRLFCKFRPCQLNGQGAQTVGAVKLRADLPPWGQRSDALLAVEIARFEIAQNRPTGFRDKRDLTDLPAGRLRPRWEHDYRFDGRGSNNFE